MSRGFQGFGSKAWLPGRFGAAGWLVLLALASGAAGAVEFTMRSVHPTRVSQYSQPAAVASGHFDADRRPDMVLCYNHTTIKVFSQDAMGQQIQRLEQEVWDQALGTDPYSNPFRISECRMHVADLDGNGIDDLVVTHTRGTLVLAFSPDGSVARREYGARTAASAEGVGFLDSVLGDLDGDGDLDLVGLQRYGELLRLMNLGAGQFSAGLPAGRIGHEALTTTKLAVGDLDSDGFADVAAAVRSGYYYKGTTALFYSDGTGQLVERSTFRHPVGYVMGAVAIGDVTGDGKDDLVLANGANQPRSIVAVYEQDGNGALMPLVAYPAYDIPESVRIEDLDGDGRNDVLLLHPTWYSITSYLQQPDGSLDFNGLLRGVYSMQAQGSRSTLSMHDFKGDGCKDILLATEHYSWAEGTGCLPASNADVRATLELDPSGAVVQVRNSDPAATAFAVVATVRLAAEGLSAYLPAAPDGCSATGIRKTGRMYVCRFPSLGPGEVRTISLPLAYKPAKPGQYRVTADARVTAHGGDPVPGNNAALRELRGFTRKLGRGASPPVVRGLNRRVPSASH